MLIYVFPTNPGVSITLCLSHYLVLLAILILTIQVSGYCHTNVVAIYISLVAKENKYPSIFLLVSEILLFFLFKFENNFVIV